MISDRVLASEREFFDREAGELDEERLIIPTGQIERYRHARPDDARNIPKDALFAHLRPLEGKHVLDYGCGHGENACLLAACGARVSAFDLSPLAVAKARRRAELLGVEDRIQFDVLRAGQTGYPPGSFDAVLGFAILHHLHGALPSIFEEVSRLLKPAGTAYFVEPMANSPGLRLLRRLVPVRCYATQDEKQLVYQDLEPLRQHFSGIELHHYYGMERLHRVLGEWVRVPLRRFDHHAQRLLPPLRRYYGDVLVIASKGRPAG